jgi:hypothetical protein
MVGERFSPFTDALAPVDVEEFGIGHAALARALDRIADSCRRSFIGQGNGDVEFDAGEAGEGRVAAPPPGRFECGVQGDLGDGHLAGLVS